MENLKPAEAAKLLNVSVYTIKQWIYKGKIHSIKTAGGHHRIPRSEIDRFTGSGQMNEPEPKQPLAGVEKERLRILVAEDNLDSRDLLHEQIRLWGYEVTIVSTPAEALALTQSGSFDLYILDNWFSDGPGIKPWRAEDSGIELCRRIRESDSVTPIIFYSAIRSEEERKKAIEAGAQGYILKPYFDQLQVAISQQIQNRLKAHR